MNVMSVVNEKGGVGKTTLAANLGYLLASELNHRTLLIDLDQQANLSSLYHPDTSAEPSVSAVFKSRNYELIRCISNAIIQEQQHDNLHIAHSNITLSQAVRDIPVRTNREKLLAKALDGLQDRFDTVIIDCPPSADDAVLNALYAANIVLVPVEMGGFADNAIQDILDLITDVKGYETPGETLANEKVVFVRNKLDGRVPALNAKVNEQLSPIAPFLSKATCRIASTTSHAAIAKLPLALQEPNAPLLDDYRELLQEVLA